jgi:hypothetical protein
MKASVEFTPRMDTKQSMGLLLIYANSNLDHAGALPQCTWCLKLPATARAILLIKLTQELSKENWEEAPYSAQKPLGFPQSSSLGTPS